jgi:hypothetical protein
VQIRGCHVEDDPPRGHQRIQPSPILGELPRPAVPQPVVLDGDALLGIGQVDARHEAALVVPDDVLRDRRQPRQGEDDPQSRLGR